MKKSLLFMSMLAFAAHSFAQTDYYKWELQNITDISRLPEYRTGEMYQLSSYDRTGGNDDGFSGKYSYIRKEGNDLVIADLKGAGVINRIWTPTPSNDTIQFYFDGEKVPRISMPFIDLFSGKKYPFVEPLCGNEVGGYYCYLPIPYAVSLKIIYKGNDLKFHQTQYRKLTEKEKVKSFSWDDFNKDSGLAAIKKTWNKTSFFEKYGNRIKTQKINITLKGREEVTFFQLQKGGRIVGIEIDGNSQLQSRSDKLMFKAVWDKEEKSAIDVPLHSFFGYAFGKPSMNSILLGSTSSMAYSYLPMPFDDCAKLSIVQKGDDEITITGKIYYTEDKRDSKREGKLYVQARREYLPQKGEPYVIADISGKGHYVGTILIAQGLDEGMTEYWESDDCSVVDGEMRMHGTGAEDYFNGGWYAVTDRWDRGISLPIHGSLLYELKTARTGGYRFYLTDKVSFRSSYVLTFEHGPEGNQLNVDYTSVGLFYSDTPQFENKHLLQVTNEKPRRDILLPQDMTMRLYWFTQVAQGDGSSMLISSKREDHWTTNIDFEAVPMVQFELSGMENGTYKMYVAHTGMLESKPFSIWQRTNQVSEWISNRNNQAEAISYAGEIEISDQVNTITIRKMKMDDTSVQINRFIFEKTSK